MIDSLLFNIKIEYKYNFEKHSINNYIFFIPTDDINCLNFSKLSISSPRSSRKDLKNSGQTMPTETNSYRPLLPRIEFPSGQFDRLLRMDSKDMKNNWKSNETKKNTK